MTRQERDDYCGCACALTILRLLGIPSTLSQDAFYDLGGNMLFSVQSLSEALSLIAGERHVWHGRGVHPPEGYDYPSLLNVLSNLGPWIAHLRQTCVRVGHFVIVVGREENRLEILDPAGPGTAYSMTEADFLAYWNYQAVYPTVRA